MIHIRFAITKLDRDGNRSIHGPAWSRCMHDSREAAERHLADILKNTGMDRLCSIYGEQAPVECWETGDPKGIYV
jgi:hypothetical protein